MNNSKYVPTSILFCTLYLKYNNSSGTCFSINISGKQYFLTARHVIEGAKTSNFIEILNQQNWNKMAIRLIGHSNNADISVFAIADIIIGGDATECVSNEAIVSQDMFFLGYPYGLKSDIKALNSGFPLPLIKKCILSGIILDNTKKIFLLDGMNNPGFSGGPVAYYNEKKGSFCFAAVISGYQFELLNVTQNNLSTNFSVKTNTGIIVSYGIESALELINNNPTGTVIPKF